MTESSRTMTATFFISAGRCGTQWLAKALNRHYADLAEVTHEPLIYKYCPKTMLRTRLPVRDRPNFELLRRHLIRIARVLREKDYIETGWPVFAAIPVMYRNFQGRMKLVHLTRHPVYSACSMVTHRYYQPTRQDGFTLYAFLEPFDPGIRFKEYVGRWGGMSPYEKCLFHWAEINAYAMELRKALEGHVPWLHIRMEELMDPESGVLAELMSFLGLPVRDGPIKDMRERVDDYHEHTKLPLDWRQIFGHPKVLQLAAEFGYNADSVSAETIETRYRVQD